MLSVQSLVVIAGLLSNNVTAGTPPTAEIFTTAVDGKATVGKTGDLILKIVPAKGYHWNTEYPAKMTLTHGKRVGFAKTALTRADISGDEHAGLIKVTAKGRSTGEESIDATGSFSICNKETCHLLKDRKLSFKVTVR